MQTVITVLINNDKIETMLFFVNLIKLNFTLIFTKYTFIKHVTAKETETISTNIVPLS